MGLFSAKIAVHEWRAIALSDIYARKRCRERGRSMSQKQGYNIVVFPAPRTPGEYEKENLFRQKNMKKKKCCAFAVRYNERAAEFYAWRNVGGTVVRMCHRHGSGDC